jgi:predicted alpha/beta hydrolase
VVRAGDGTLLSGAVGGDGATGVVLAPGYTPTVCEWGRYAEVLMRHGYRVLTFENRALAQSAFSRQRLRGQTCDSSTMDFR